MGSQENVPQPPAKPSDLHRSGENTEKEPSPLYFLLSLQLHLVAIRGTAASSLVSLCPGGGEPSARSGCWSHFLRRGGQPDWDAEQVSFLFTQ